MLTYFWFGYLVKLGTRVSTGGGQKKKTQIENYHRLSTMRQRKGWDTDKVRVKGTEMSKRVLLGERCNIY